MKNPEISILIAILNEGDYLRKCLDSLLNQSYTGDTEIIIADGGSKDNSLQIIEEYQKKYDNIRLIHNDKVNQAAGRNLAAQNAKYDLIAYIDGHSYADEKWLETLVKTYNDYYEDKLFGIGSVYFNSDKSLFTKANDSVMKSLLAGAGDEHFLNSKDIKKVDNAYACIYNKNIFVALGGYKEFLLTGEDIELNQRATKKGYKLLVNPDAKTYYKRKSNLIDFIKQQFRYGFWRALLLKTDYFEFKPLTPALFIIFLVAGLVLSFTNKYIYEVYNYAVLFYIVIVFYYSAKIGIKNKVSSFLCFLISVSLHFSYGAGIISGIIFNNKK